MNLRTWAGGKDATALEIDSRSSLLLELALVVVEAFDDSIVEVDADGCDAVAFARRGSFLFNDVTVVVVVVHNCHVLSCT